VSVCLSYATVTSKRLHTSIRFLAYWLPSISSALHLWKLCKNSGTFFWNVVQTTFKMWPQHVNRRKTSHSHQLVIDNTWRRRLTDKLPTTVDRRQSPVDHTQRPALCTARWATGRDATCRAGLSASIEFVRYTGGSGCLQLGDQWQLCMGCPRSKRKRLELSTPNVIHTHCIAGTSACIDTKVKRSKVKITALWSVLPA